MLSALKERGKQTEERGKDSLFPVLSSHWLEYRHESELRFILTMRAIFQGCREEDRRSVVLSNSLTNLKLLIPGRPGEGNTLSCLRHSYFESL